MVSTFVSLVTYMTDVQTQNGQLVSIERQEELEQRQKFGLDINIKTRSWIQGYR